MVGNRGVVLTHRCHRVGHIGEAFELPGGFRRCSCCTPSDLRRSLLDHVDPIRRPGNYSFPARATVRPGIDPELNRQEAWRFTVAASKQGTKVDEAEIEGLGFVKAGQEVVHPKFGRGVIESFFVCRDGTVTVWVNFGSLGPKALLPKYAALRLAD